MVAAFAGWPDAHEAASRAVKYLVRRLPAQKFAEIDPEEFYVFTRLRPVVRIDEGGKRTIHWPANDFSYWRNEAGDHDLILFSGSEPQLRWRTYVEAVLDLAKRHDVRTIIAVGSLLDAVPHTREPVITGSANVTHLQEILEGSPAVRPGYQGPTGIGTTLMDACTRQGIRYATLWGHSPHYLQTTANAKVTYALLDRLVPLLQAPVSLGDLVGQCEAFEAQVAKLVADNAEIRSYVQRLEKQHDQSAGSLESPTSDDLPSPELVIKELEEFLRQQHPEEDPPGAS